MRDSAILNFFSKLEFLDEGVSKKHHPPHLARHTPPSPAPLFMGKTHQPELFVRLEHQRQQQVIPSPRESCPLIPLWNQHRPRILPAM